MTSLVNLRRFDPWDAGYYGLLYLLLAVLLFITVVPFVYILGISFRPPAEFLGGAHWIPHNPTLKPWTGAIDRVGSQLINSTLISFGTAAISLIITIPGAYVFGRQQFPGKEIAFYGIIIALLFPFILLIVPISDVWNDLGLFNTIPGMWLAYQVFVTPFAMWVLRDFFEQLPSDLEEAAQVYGCTQFQAFYRVIIPLAYPGIIAVGFMAFLTAWNDFLFANMLTTGTGPRPAVVSIFIVATGTESNYWGLVMAMTLIVGTPPTVLYMIARRYISDAFAVN